MSSSYTGAYVAAIFFGVVVIMGIIGSWCMCNYKERLKKRGDIKSDMAMPDGTLPNCIDLSEAFTTNEIFHTRDDLVRWARETGKANGTVVIIRRSDKAIGKSGRKNVIVFGCAKHGKHTEVDVDCSKERRVSSKKCDCPFKLKAKPLNPPVEDGKVEVRCGVHNHKPSPSCIGLPIFGRFTKEEKSMLAEHTLLNVKAEKSLTALKKRFVGNLSTITQLYKQRRMFRTSRGGSRTEIQELMRLIDQGSFSRF